MKSKITLYSDKEIIEEMKLYAKEQNTSVSNKLKIITNSLIGVIEIETSKDDYQKYLEDKVIHIPKSDKTIWDSMFDTLDDFSDDFMQTREEPFEIKILKDDTKIVIEESRKGINIEDFSFDELERR